MLCSAVPNSAVPNSAVPDSAVPDSAVTVWICALPESVTLSCSTLIQNDDPQFPLLLFCKFRARQSFFRHFSMHFLFRPLFLCKYFLFPILSGKWKTNATVRQLCLFWGETRRRVFSSMAAVVWITKSERGKDIAHFNARQYRFDAVAGSGLKRWRCRMEGCR
jgi:hypothetical protein